MVNPPTEVLDLANSCVAAVQKAVGVELDFTQDTLPVLDHYAQIESSDDDEILALVAPMLGAYFGEVIRRTVGPAEWSCPNDAHAEWRLQFDRMSLRFNPVGLALEVLTGEDAGAWGANLQMEKADRPLVESALAAYGDVSEEDYYRFSVRFEGIEQAYNAFKRKYEIN